MATKYITQNGKFLKWGDKYVIVVGDSVTGDPASGTGNKTANFIQGTKLYTLVATEGNGNKLIFSDKVSTPGTDYIILSQYY